MDSSETPDARPGAAPSADLLDPDERADERVEAAQVAPPVVAVVVTSQDAPGLDRTLVSLADQDYPSLSVLVLDNGSDTDPTARIAAAMPRAFVRRLETGTGFGGAANETLQTVEGATFLLFCHDDVVFDTTALRVMVEEAYRSNAGIVGAKLVQLDHPDVLLEVGMAVDHYGVPFSAIEPGEVDQEQHDAVRDVFFVSHAAMLVRADLFHELGGFDAATFPGSDDVDLCWRARLAGARVVVAPDARVQHRQATVNDARAGVRRAGQSLREQTRARVRMLYKNYSGIALVWILPTAFLLGLLESIALVFTGRARRARSMLAGWFASARELGELRQARATAQDVRRVEDRDVRELMVRGSARVRGYFVRNLHGGDRLADVTTRTRERVSAAGTQLRRAPAVLAAVLAVVVLFGSRGLLFGRVAAVGTFLDWKGVGALWSTFTSPWRYAMLGAPRPPTPAFGMMATASTVLIGHAGLARSIVVAGALPLGVYGVYRLARPLTNAGLPAVAAAIAYAANPIARNAIAHGQLGPTVTQALAPFVLAALIRAGADETPTAGRRHAALSAGILGAVMTSVWPPAIVLVAAMAVAVLAAVPFVGDWALARRFAIWTAAALGVAVVLLLPWIASLVRADGPTLGMVPRAPLTLAEVLRFDSGSSGSGFVAWGLLVAAVVPLAIASGTRLAWAARAWMLALLSFAAAWLPARLSSGAAVGAPEGVLTGAALGLALATGLGVAAFTDDVRRAHFGWRQLLAVAAAVGLALPALGLVVDALPGRWGLPHDDWATSFSWMDDQPSPGGFRVLWIGDPAILPGSPRVADGVGYTLTRDGADDVRAQYPAPETSADRVVARAVALTRAGGTARLGHMVAPAGVRYVAYITRAAPTGGAHGRPDPALERGLADQLDLSVSHIMGTTIVYENDAWMARRALVPANDHNVQVDGTQPLAAAMRSDPTGVRGVANDGHSSAATGPGTVLWSEAADGGWRATANGQQLDRRDAFGWTNAFTLTDHAKVRITFASGFRHLVVLVFELGIWIAALAVWFVGGRVLARRRSAGA